MMTFGRVLEAILRTCEEDAATKAKIERYCIVRDVRGRTRLIIEPVNRQVLSLVDLEEALARELEDYFVGPILSAQRNSETNRLASKLLELAASRWPTGWPEEYRTTLGMNVPIEARARWVGIERTIGKEAWLTESPDHQWPLIADKTPPIVTFHSFKGGVGRTTLVGAFALQLASAKSTRRVAVVDLDLEAPGIGSLFGVATPRGVLDVLVDHLATGRIDLTDASALVAVDDGIEGEITVFSAGNLDDSYIQKLARLDFSSTEPSATSPVGKALGELLERMKDDFDVILLDSRAGLHDLAGMSLHGLAHVDVLVFRGTEQNFAGLGQTLRTLGVRSAPKLVLVETMLPANDEEVFRARRQRTRARVYELLSKYVYEDDDPPPPADLGGPHDVVHVRRREWLDGLDSIVDRAQQVLAEDDLAAVGSRIREQCELAVDEEQADQDDPKENEQ